MLKHTWRLTFGLSGSMLLCSAPAQAQFLHNPQAEEQANAALDEYHSTRNAHLALFKARSDALAAMATRLEAAIATALRSERDATIVDVLQAPRAQRAGALGEQIDERISAIVGGDGNAKLLKNTTDPLLEALLNRADITSRINGRRPFVFTDPSRFDETEAARIIGEAHARITAATAGPGTFKYQDLCINRLIRAATPAAPRGVIGVAQMVAELKLMGLTASLPADKDLKQIAFDLAVVCGRVLEVQEQAQFLEGLKQAPRNYQPFISLAGYAVASDQYNGAPSVAIRMGQTLFALKDELDTARNDVKTATDLAKKLKDQQTALKEAANRGAKAEITKYACELVKLIGTPMIEEGAASLSCLDKDKAGTTGEATALAGSVIPVATITAPPAPAAADDLKSIDLCEQRVTLGCARTIAEELGLASFDRLRAEIAYEIAGYLSDPDALANTAAEICKPTDMDGTAKNKRICMTQAGIETLDLLDQISGIATGQPGRLAELALLITDAENRIADAEARAASLSQQIDNLASQRQALAAELRILLAADHMLEQRADPRRALLVVARSYDEGRIAFQQGADRQQLLRLAGFNVREEKATRGRYAIADGLLGTVSTATKSGLTSEDAARFLAAIGVTTLGVAEVAK